MFNRCKTAAIAAILGVTVAYPAHAHITLDVKEAKLGQSYKAVLKVPHGCSGSATVSIHLQVPEGFFSAKPQPKAGWKLETVKGKYANTYKNHGATVSEGVTEITWSGGPLPDDFYEEFVFVGTVADSLKANTMMYFPTVATCETGVERWIQIPEAGKDAHDYPNPAPGLKLVK